MTTTAGSSPVPTTGSFDGLSDLKLVSRQVKFEQLSFWLNPLGAIFTVGFSTVFLLITESASGKSVSSAIGGIKLIQYYVPSFVAYGIMSSCFSILAIVIVNRREFGLLKRLRLSPAPTWILMAALFISTAIITLIQIVLMLGVGKGYGVTGPANWLPFIVTMVVAMFCFTGLGMGVSTLVPNADAAGPIVNIVFFIVLGLSGLWGPIASSSSLSKFMNYLPARRLILALEGSFNHIPGVAPWAWSDLGVIALWGVGGMVVALRRWQWAPRRG